MTQSVSGFTNAIGDEMSKWMTPMLKQWSSWLDRLRETPGAMKTVTAGADILAAAIGVGIAGGVTKLIWAMNRWWALPAVKFLLSPAGSALLAFEGFTSHGFGQFVPGRLPRHGSYESFLQHANPAPQPDWLQRQFNNLWDRLHLPHAGGQQGALAPHSSAACNLAANNPGNIRALGGGWMSYASPEAGI